MLSASTSLLDREEERLRYSLLSTCAIEYLCQVSHSLIQHALSEYLYAPWSIDIEEQDIIGAGRDRERHLTDEAKHESSVRLEHVL